VGLSMVEMSDADGVVAKAISESTSLLGNAGLGFGERSAGEAEKLDEGTSPDPRP